MSEPSERDPYCADERSGKTLCEVLGERLQRAKAETERVHQMMDGMDEALLAARKQRDDAEAERDQLRVKWGILAERVLYAQAILDAEPDGAEGERDIASDRRALLREVFDFGADEPWKSPAEAERDRLRELLRLAEADNAEFSTIAAAQAATVERVRTAIEAEREQVREREAMDGSRPMYDAVLNVCAHIEAALTEPPTVGIRDAALAQAPAAEQDGGGQ